MNPPAWIALAISIILEVAGTTALKFSDGFSKLTPSILVCVFYGISFYAFAHAVKKIDLSTAYAVWAGSGTALVAIVGFIWFQDSITTLKILSLGLIVAGVAGLNYAGA